MQLASSQHLEVKRFQKANFVPKNPGVDIINKVSGDSFKECAVFSDVLNQAHPHVFVFTQAICKVNDKFISILHWLREVKTLKQGYGSKKMHFHPFWLGFLSPFHLRHKEDSKRDLISGI